MAATDLSKPPTEEEGMQRQQTIQLSYAPFCSLAKLDYALIAGKTTCELVNRDPA